MSAVEQADEDDLMDIEEVEKLTGLSYHSVRRAIKAGRLRALKLEGRWKIRISAYRAWLDSAEYQAPAPAARNGASVSAPTVVPPKPSRAPAAGSVQRLRDIERKATAT